MKIRSVLCLVDFVFTETLDKKCTTHVSVLELLTIDMIYEC